MVLALTLQWHLGSMHMERPRLRKASEIFITQRQPAGTKEKISFPFSPRPLVFVMYLLFPSVRLFFAVWRRQGERVFFSHCDCTGVHWWPSGGTVCVLFQASWHVCCHGRPWKRFSSSPCVSASWQNAVCEVFSICVKPDTYNFRPKTKGFHRIEWNQRKDSSELR